MMLRSALVQLTSGENPDENLPVIEDFIRTAQAGGARFITTPEASNIISFSRSHQDKVLRVEADDKTLARLRIVAAELSVWLLIGSLAVKTGAADGRYANRSFLIGPDGAIVARYDKIHMFDVTLGDGETYAESQQFQRGERAVLASSDFGKIGMTICYDLRFAGLFRQLAQAGAAILTVPAAFTVPTGQAHWHALLRARAIETGCFVLAPAQCNIHDNGRKTYGHSLAIDPWGNILAEAGTHSGVTFVDLDLSLVETARARIPALTHDREFTLHER